MSSVLSNEIGRHYRSTTILINRDISVFLRLVCHFHIRYKSILNFKVFLHRSTKPFHEPDRKWTISVLFPTAATHDYIKRKANNTTLHFAWGYAIHLLSLRCPKYDFPNGFFSVCSLRKRVSPQESETKPSENCTLISSAVNSRLVLAKPLSHPRSSVIEEAQAGKPEKEAQHSPHGANDAAKVVEQILFIVILFAVVEIEPGFCLGALAPRRVKMVFDLKKGIGFLS